MKTRLTLNSILFFFIRILFIWTFILILFFLLPLSFNILDNASSYRYVRYLIEADRMFLDLVNHAVPTRIKGADISRWLILFILCFAAFELKKIKEDILYKIEELKEARFFAKTIQRKSFHRLWLSLKYQLRYFLSNIKKIRLSRRSPLRVLLLERKNIDQQLDLFKRKLVFLSVDVVNSTAMKEHEDPSLVNYAFSEYRKFLENIFLRNNSIKSSWTPDGVMVCFSKFEEAFSAGKNVLLELSGFNQTVKTIRSDFSVRCGINSGIVYFDEHMSMEELTGRAIDVAGHLQKQADPGTILVTELSIDAPELFREFDQFDKIIDGYKVYLWKNIT
ncbi:MAG TPA: hypothetical protein VJC03_02220 [bacterium]|nr:hypothetical protein [bacterium]